MQSTRGTGLCPHPGLHILAHASSSPFSPNARQAPNFFPGERRHLPLAFFPAYS